MIDPTGMSAENPGEGDPVKQPQKILNIKVYGEDRSIYYDGEAFSFGTGGFKFISGDSGTRGDLSLLKGNSGEGESVDADGAFGLASYTKAFGSGSMYKTFKEGVQFIGNLIDLISKGKDIKDGVERAIGSDTPKTGSTTVNTSQKMMDVKTKNFKIIYPNAYTDGFVWGKDTIIKAEEGQGQFINFKAKADSIYKASVLESFKTDYVKKYRYDNKN